MVWRAPFLAVELAFFGGWALLEGLTGTRTPMLAGLAANASNVVLNLLLIPGLWRLPALGPTGAALATNLSLLVGLIVLARATRRAIRRTACVTSSVLATVRATASCGLPRREDRALARRFLRLGWPLGLCGLMDLAGCLAIGLLIPRLGAAAAAAHGIIGQLIALGLATAHGSSAAAVLLVARALGRRDTALALARALSTLKLQIALGLLVGAVAWLCGRAWVPLFTTDAQASAGADRLLPIGLLVIAVEGPALVLAGIIEGAGRTRLLLLSTLMFDVLFGMTAAVLVLPRGTVTSFYWVWVAKDALKVAFLLLSWRDSVRGGVARLAPEAGSPPMAGLALGLARLVRSGRVLRRDRGRRSEGRQESVPGFARPWWMTPLPDG
jgi:Na+-driven multidrug efflux pump